MPPDRWERIKELFDSAMELPASRRPQYLDQECGGDPSLRSEVERLLNAHENAGDFLIRPAVEPVISLFEGEVVSGRYCILRLLGRGGMGEVYEAEDQLLHETVALKTLRADIARREDYVRRFKREIQLARKVTHPNVCRVFEVGEHRCAEGGRAPVHFLTMELLRGETLHGHIRRLGKIPAEDAIPIITQLADGLQAAHEAGIVHTDFKSSNVILCTGSNGAEYQRAVITDFGLARVNPRVVAPEQMETVSAALQFAGTLGYMSPEQLTGGEITAASDIYSFGIVLFEMATGGLPFNNHNPVQAAMQRVGIRDLEARVSAASLPPRWRSAIVRCLQPAPEERFASARDVAEWFQTSRWRSPVVHWTRRDWMLASVPGVAALAAGSSLWAWITRPYQPPAVAMEWYRKGLDAMHSMTYEAARNALEQAVGTDGQFALARAELARAYEELDYSDLARESMLRAVAIARDTRIPAEDDLRLRALQFLVSRDFDRAEALFQQMESSASRADKAAAALEAGWVAQQRDETEAAAQAFERALKLDPAYAAAKLRLAVNMGRRGRIGTEAALKSFAEAEHLYTAASNYEGITQTLFQQATFLNRSGRYEDALPIIERALGLASSTRSFFRQIQLKLLQGVVQRNLGHSGLARDAAREAMETARDRHLEDTMTSGLIDLANAFYIRGEAAPAEEYYRQALDSAQRSKTRRSEARARLALGSFLAGHDRVDQAEVFIEAALPFYRQAGYPRELTQAGLLLGGIYEHRAELERSEKQLRESVKAADQQTDKELAGQAHMALGSVLVSAGNWPEALSEMEQTIRLQRASLGLAFAKLACANLYWRLGRPVDATQAFAEVHGMFQSIQGDQGRLRERFFRRKAEMAYGEGKYAEAAKLARQARAEVAKAGDLETGPADFLAGLAQIRLGQVAGGKEVCDRALKVFEAHSDVYGYASGQLSLAEALLDAGRRAEAETLARGAVLVFEPRRVWEPLWRCHWVIARASGGSLAASVDALEQLRMGWPQGSFDGYRKSFGEGIRKFDGVFR